jgi:5'/3'-nucleotidase SurE
MLFSSALVAALSLTTHAINVVLTNDDGWAEINIRRLFNSLTSAGFSTIISAPAENQSGTSSSDAEPKPVGSKGCQYASCPANSPATGRNESEPRINACGRTT